MIATLEKLDNGKIEFSYFGLKPKDMEIGTKYTITKYVKKRSLDSNRMFWGILQKISEETDNDLMDLYITLLEQSNAKYEFLLVLPETIEELKKVFRAVKVLEYRDYNGKQMAVVKAYIGSSKFNTKEMKKLIDKALQMASENNIVIEMED